MEPKESGNHPILKGTLWGAAMGAVGSISIVSYLDDLAYFLSDSRAKKFQNAEIKAIVAATVVGAGIGAFVSARGHRAWSDRVDESAQDRPLSR